MDATTLHTNLIEMLSAQDSATHYNEAGEEWIPYLRQAQANRDKWRRVIEDSFVAISAARNHIESDLAAVTAERDRLVKRNADLEQSQAVCCCGENVIDHHIGSGHTAVRTVDGPCPDCVYAGAAAKLSVLRVSLREEVAPLLEDTAELLSFAYNHFAASDDPEWRMEANRIRQEANEARSWATRLREGE